MNRQALTFVIVFLGLILMVNVVYAPWSTLGTGYAITSNFHGTDILPGTPVTVTAGSLDPNVVQVTFRWHTPDESVAREWVVPIFTNGTEYEFKNGTKVPIRYAIDTFTPEVIGDWGVQAFFQDSTGKDRAGLEDVIKIRATSFNVIPEVPLGTIVIILGMFGALGLFAMVKKRSTVSTKPA